MKTNLLLGEAEEPPSRQTAASQLSTKPHRLISPHSPTLPSLGAVVTRLERFPIGPATRAFRKRFYPEVEPTEWNDWRWQLRNRIRTLAELERIFALSDDERDAVAAPHRLAAASASRPIMRASWAATTRSEPLRRTHIMVGDEYRADAGRGGRSARRGPRHGRAGPRPSLSRPRAVPDHRHLLDLLPLLHALAHGRQAGRRVPVQPSAMGQGARLSSTAHPEIRDVLLSGGDPLTHRRRQAGLSARPAARDQACRVRPHRHQDAGRAAAAHDPDADEDAEEAPSAVDEPALHPSGRADAGGDRGLTARLADAGIPLGSQTVLLKGINDERRHAEDADARPAEAPRAALLPLSVRSDQRLRPFPHHASTRASRSSARCAATPPAMPMPIYRRRRAGRRRQDPAVCPIRAWAATATTCCSRISRARSIAIPIRTERWRADRTRIAAE